MEEARVCLTVFGGGYSGQAVAARAGAAGYRVQVVNRVLIPDLAETTHILSTVPPDPDGDPVLRRFQAAIAAAPRLRWIGYMSTTGVYGDRQGAVVHEDTPPVPGQDRGRRRLAAEAAWCRFAGRVAVDLLRTAGIYGPGRSAFSAIRAGTATRVLRPGHVFGRIHRTDIARAILAAMGQDRAAGVRVLHLADDEPAEPQAVMAEAARLLGQPPPPAIPFDQAFAAMSPMARSFWDEHRRVSSRLTRAALGIDWLYPSYREGLAAILIEETGEGALQQGDVPRP
jgi:nucleoside-diphosphate-sugar epimerase